MTMNRRDAMKAIGGALAGAAVGGVAASMEWSDADAERLRELMAVEYEAETLREYIARVSPSLPLQRHMEPIVDALQDARDAARDPGAPIRIILIEMPPRHGKTTTVMHGLSWRTVRDPGLTNAYITYGDTLSASKSSVMRAQATAAGVALAPDMANLSEWRTVHGGGLLSGGIMGGLTGKGIDGFLVVDDAIKNREEAESEVYRDKAWDQFTDVCFTRLEGVPTVVVMATRWHPDDLIGRILDRRQELEEGLDGAIQIIRIHLPAIAEEGGDILGRQVGEALWPARFDVRRLRAIRAMIGEYSWNAMFQQNPRHRGAIVFNDTPARFAMYAKDGTQLWYPTGHRMLICCDPAASAKTKADHSAAYVMAAQGYGPTMNVWIVDGFSRQLTIPQLVRALQALREKWYGIAIAVEAVSAFRAVPDILHEEDPDLPVIAVTPKGDKFMRAQGFASAWNNGRAHVPLDDMTPWAAELIKQVAKFTGLNDKRDDEVDACSHGYNELFDAVANYEPRGDQVADYLPFG